MNKIFIIIAAIVFCSSAFADDPCQSASGPYGPMTCGVGITSSISANGPVTLKDTIVKQAAQVNGTMDAEKGIFNQLTVNGDVKLKDSRVQGLTDINGQLQAINTTFQDTIQLSANSASLADSQTADITIDDSGDGIVSPQVLTITGKSVVDGDITFTAKDGIVKLAATAKITGKVIGGKLEKLPAQTQSTTTQTNATQENSKP